MDAFLADKIDRLSAWASEDLRIQDEKRLASLAERLLPTFERSWK